MKPTLLLVFTLFLLSYDGILLTEGVPTCSVTFYWDSGYGGNKFTMYSGDNRPNLVSYGWNDQISSLKFITADDGTRCGVHACWNTYCSGEGYGGALDYIDDQPFVGGFANDQFSAVRVFSFKPTDSWAHFYKDCDYAGYQWFVSPVNLPNKEDIFLNTLSINHIGNDALSKVVVSKFAAVKLYVDDYYKGGQLLIVGPATYNCLTDNGWNDATSSIRFYDLSKGGAFPSPLGSWSQQTSTGFQQTLSYVFTATYATTDTHSKTDTFGMELTTSAEAGMDFGGVSAKVTVSATVSSSIASTVESTLARGTSVTCTLTCAPNTCSSGFVYLWTWHMSFTRPWDGTPNTNIDSCNYVCRCGSGPPQCPLNQCVDTSCNTCKPGTFA